MLKMISNLNNTSSKYSIPVHLCFCTQGLSNVTVPNCSYTPPTVNVTRGEKFNVSLVAVDQVNRTIANTTIHAYLNSLDSGLDPGQTEQKTKDGCTNLTYSIISKQSSVQLVLYAEGPCRNASRSQQRLNISFLNCSCPLGFQVDGSENNCHCSRHPLLLPYIRADLCDSTTQLIFRKSSAWISYIRNNNSNS